MKLHCWVAMDEAAQCCGTLTCLFFQEEPKLKRGYWTNGIARFPITNPEVGRKFKLRPGQVKEVILEVE